MERDRTSGVPIDGDAEVDAVYISPLADFLLVLSITVFATVAGVTLLVL
ncbi:hypothetical protein [Halovivax gelatinilyticus]|nr:hypothetical protein [Halovivax gelatinilyticus]